MAQKTMATCPECGAKVRKDNLKGHIERVHRKVEEAPKEKPKSMTRRQKPRRTVSPWPAIFIGLILGLSAIGVLAYTQMMSSPSNSGTPSTGNKIAIVSTNYGPFKIQLRVDKAPITAGNFISLAESGFYNGLTFHRVVRSSIWVVQGGDPNGDGTGGSGQTIPWENTRLENVKYSVAMARSGDPNTDEGANTATSQFFINTKDNPGLDYYAYPFVVFGEVIEGQSVVDAIGQVPTDSNDRPMSPVIMNTVVITTQ